MQTGAPHRSKSEEELVIASSAVWQEPVVAPEKASIQEGSQSPLAGLASGELASLLFNFVFFNVHPQIRNSCQMWRCVFCLDICADRW